MGNVIKGCTCIKANKDKLDESINKDYQEEIPKSLIDIKINLKNFVLQRNENPYEKYEKISLLGSGSFGDVYKVKRKKNNAIRALKEINKKYLKEINASNELKNEINILKEIDHPNILKIYEFFEDNEKLYIVMEFCDSGDISEKMDNFGEFGEFVLKYVMYQVFLGVNFLHLKKVVHGDIKRENIALIKKRESNETNEKKSKKNDIFKIFNKEREIQEEILKAKNFSQLSERAKYLIKELSKYEIKLVDFGSAKMKTKKDRDKKLTGITGTAFYCSPEVVKNNYDYECDEWSCGVLMYILLSGLPPFDGGSEEIIFKNVLNSEPDLDIPRLEHVSKSCKQLISKLLIKDPNKRIRSDEVLKDKFFTKGINIGALLEGKEEDNKEALKNLLQNVSRRFQQKAKKDSVFKTAVIAYIALNFVNKEDEKKANEIYRQLSAKDVKHIITKKSFNENMKDIFGNFSQEEIDKLFESLDNNNNNEIEYEELIRGLSDKKNLLNNNNLREAFNFFDEDLSGEITWNEIAHVIFPGKKIPEKIISEFLDEIGQKDINLSINFDEFKRIILSE